MNEVLCKQQMFLELLGDHGDGMYTKGDIVSYIKEHLFNMNEEVNELILAIGNNDRTIFKPWSSRYNNIAFSQFISNSDIREEAIDMLCFCINICLAVGLTPANINNEYDKKWQKNIKRQEDNY